jgi:hypothetical protein
MNNVENHDNLDNLRSTCRPKNKALKTAMPKTSAQAAKKADYRICCWLPKKSKTLTVSRQTLLLPQN